MIAKTILYVCILSFFAVMFILAGIAVIIMVTAARIIRLNRDPTKEEWKAGFRRKWWELSLKLIT